MNINRDTFYKGYRKQFGKLDQNQVNGLEYLLDGLESEVQDIGQAAYMLATVKHECANTYHPIKEYRNRVGSKGRANQDRYWLTGYYGRGFVQLTWKKGYEAVGKGIGVDLVNNPDLALDPNIAFRVMVYGMRHGTFTGKKLSDYISGSKKDYINARRVINGTDKSSLIAGYAKQFEQILKDSPATSTGSKTATPGPAVINPLITTTDNQPEPAINSAAGSTVEQTTFASSTGETASSTTVTAGANVAVGKEEQVGFFKQIWKEIAGWTIFQGGLQTLQSYKTSIDAMGLPGWIIAYVIIGACVAMLGWFLYRVAKYLLEWWGKRKRTDVLATVNSTPTNQVIIVPEDQLEQYEKEGWIVIRRK